MVAVKTELEYEQAYVSILYQRLDTLRVRAADRLAQLWSAESGLCFGRLDLADGTRRYIGRLGLADDDRESLLVDWRAPAARPFYRATPADPSGVVRRRHLRTKGRIVVDFEDDVLDLDALSDDERSGLSGEAALLAALNASRTGRMGDIVATIQAEQDRIIRSDLPALHLAGAAVAGGDRRAAGHHRRAVPGRDRDRHGAAGDRRAQGLRAHGRHPGRGRRRPPAPARRGPGDPVRRPGAAAGPADLPARPPAGSGGRHAAQPGQGDVPARAAGRAQPAGGGAPGRRPARGGAAGRRPRGRRRSERGAAGRAVAARTGLRARGPEHGRDR